MYAHFYVNVMKTVKRDNSSGVVLIKSNILVCDYGEIMACCKRLQDSTVFASMTHIIIERERLHHSRTASTEAIYTHTLILVQQGNIAQCNCHIVFSLSVSVFFFLRV